MAFPHKRKKGILCHLEPHDDEGSRNEAEKEAVDDHLIEELSTTDQ